MGWMLDQILDWFAGLLLDGLTAVLGAITHTLLITPDVTALPQVQALTGRSVWVVDTVFVLVFVAAGVLTMTAGAGKHARYTIEDLLPRCVVGFVAAHFSQLIAGQPIGLANALTGRGVDDTGALQAVKANVVAARQQTGALLFCVCLAIIVFLLAAAACSVIVRFAVLLVLTAAAPLALALHALPQTDGLARLWWRSYLGVLSVPVGQGWCWPPPGGCCSTRPPCCRCSAGGLLNLFMVMVLLWTTVKVPALMRRYANPAPAPAPRWAPSYGWSWCSSSPAASGYPASKR
jgi:hypothetical protein